MIKGVNKTIVEINDTGNKYFDKAILFVKPQYIKKGENLEVKAKEYIVGVGTLKSNYFLKKTNAEHKRKVATLGRIIFAYLGAIVTGLIIFFILK